MSQNENSSNPVLSPEVAAVVKTAVLPDISSLSGRELLAIKSQLRALKREEIKRLHEFGVDIVETALAQFQPDMLENGKGEEHGGFGLRFDAAGDVTRTVEVTDKSTGATVETEITEHWTVFIQMRKTDTIPKRGRASEVKTTSATGGTATS